MTVRQAWFCPSCQKHHAPHCDTCPGLSDVVAAPRQPYIVPTTVPPWNPVPAITPWTPYPITTCAGIPADRTAVGWNSVNNLH